MKVIVDLAVDVVEALGTLAIREHRLPPQQAAYLLTRWLRDAPADAGPDDVARFKARVGLAAGDTPPRKRRVAEAAQAP